MKRYSKQALGIIASNKKAKNITYEDPYLFKNERLECVGYSVGTYGIASALFFSHKNNQYYYVKERTTTLLALI